MWHYVYLHHDSHTWYIILKFKRYDLDPGQLVIRFFSFFYAYVLPAKRRTIPEKIRVGSLVDFSQEFADCTTQNYFHDNDCATDFNSQDVSAQIGY